MAPPYPTTARGLLAQLEADKDAFPAYLAALEDLAAQLWPPLASTRPPAPPGHRDLGAQAREVEKLRARQTGVYRVHKEKFPGGDQAYYLTRQVIGIVQDLPEVLISLRVIVHGTPDPVAAPLFEPIEDAKTRAGWPPESFRNIGTGQTVQDPDGPVITLEPATLPDCAESLRLLRSRAAGYDDLAASMRGGTRRTARQQARSAADAYSQALGQVEAQADPLAEQFGARLHTLTAALAALLDTHEGITMPSLTTPAVVTSLAARIHEQITQGHGGRLAVSDSEVAFAWSPGQSTTLLAYLATSTVTGRHATVVTAANAATVVGPVAEGAAKNTVVQFTSRDVDLVKYAGMAEMSVEAAQFTVNIEAATSSILVSQITRAIEAAAVTAILADAGVDIADAADITAGVLAGIAQVRANGGNPTVVGLNSTDWQEAMAAQGSSGGYLNFSSPEAGPGTWLGLHPVLLPTLTAGTALVLDGAAVSVLEPVGGPLCVVDMFSLLSTNKIRIAVETWATSQVTSPGGVATIAVTATP